MDSKQKYIEENNSVTLFMDAISQLVKETDIVRNGLFDSLEMITNQIDGEKNLGLKLPNDKGMDVFFELKVRLEKPGEYNIYGIKRVGVDRYLDLMNANKLVSMGAHTKRTIV